MANNRQRLIDRIKNSYFMNTFLGADDNEEESPKLAELRAVQSSLDGNTFISRVRESTDGNKPGSNSNKGRAGRGNSHSRRQEEQYR